MVHLVEKTLVRVLCLGIACIHPYLVSTPYPGTKRWSLVLVPFVKLNLNDFLPIPKIPLLSWYVGTWTWNGYHPIQDFYRWTTWTGQQWEEWKANTGRSWETPQSSGSVILVVVSRKTWWMVGSTKVQVSNVWFLFNLPTEGVQDTSTRKLEAAQKRVAIFWWLWDMRIRCGHKNLETETLCKHEGGVWPLWFTY